MHTTKTPERIIGVIAGNGAFPLEFVRGAKRNACKVFAVCHIGETDKAIESLVDGAVWIKVGQLGKLISSFLSFGVERVAMAGGISRISLFKGVKLDVRGIQLLARIRSTKDDLIMRGIAEELEKEGIEVISCATFMEDSFAAEGVLGRCKPTATQRADIEVGVSALRAMSAEHIGQLVIVKDGVVVAVEAVEGSDAAITRGGELGGPGVVVVKFAKSTQDMRFDIPTVGCKTLETMVKVKANVLAIEARKTLMMEKEKMIELANKHKIVLVGCS